MKQQKHWSYGNVKTATALENIFYINISENYKSLSHTELRFLRVTLPSRTLRRFFKSFWLAPALEDALFV